MGSTALVVAVPSAAGPPCGGHPVGRVLAWLFLINVPLGVFALIVAVGPCRRRPIRPTARRVQRSAQRPDLWAPDHRDRCPRVRRSRLSAVRARRGRRGGVRVRPLPAIAADAFTAPGSAPAVRVRPVDDDIGLFASAQTLAYLALPFSFHNESGCSMAETGTLMTPWPLAIAVGPPFPAV